MAFWVDRFGFHTSNQVPGEDGRLAFASVEKDGVEILYQTRASVLADEPTESRDARARDLTGHAAALFFEVDDLDTVERAVAGAPIVKARHETFYGTTEVYVREPGGTVIGFAAHTAAAGSPVAAPPSPSTQP